ncbi:putative aminoacyl tRNA synthase complex-interacting multifunctional protein 2 isoform 2 [Danaus plexippus plexippus]|uniref:Aminoacyl tRNA synthase complex-interacting multifunctional protein 2 isoform 2 n=1 Tax=Danaus plexippus plexippus TaxID=278856 RepID=A0A212F6X0_DANPL|nr:putative aminoacyl tRNA synthase complex-interacting multifunctional protein 2 isoform 2 [Danaus plexippus plexippus]
MYHMKNIVSFQEEIELPKCMYRLKNPIEVDENDEAELNIRDQVTKFLKKMSNNGLVELENRQEKLLTKLDDLYERIKTISSLCKNSQQDVKTLVKPEKEFIKPNEVVMFLHPDKLPWFMNMFLKTINGVNVSWHIHSSVPSVKIAKVESFFKKFQALYSSQLDGKVNFRLIFKCESAAPELKISSLSSPIIGSVNILRYLCLVFPNIVNYDYDDYQIDGLLDICHQLEMDSVKNKEVLTTEMFTDKTGFIYKNMFSIVDLALFNVIKQMQMGTKLVPKKWYNDCEKIIL